MRLSLVSQILVVSQCIAYETTAVRAVEDALPEFLLDALAADAALLGQRSLWLPIEELESPSGAGAMQSSLGQVLEHLKRIAFGSGARAAALGVKGAECWVQVKSSGEDLAPHFDKDERLAFVTGGADLRFPLLSTVTYISDNGGPTIVLNQTLSSDGERLQPAVPYAGAIVFPRKGRHLLFPGGYFHGVRGDLALVDRPSVARVTFLVNWWARELTPGGTLSFQFSDDWARSHELSFASAASATATTTSDAWHDGAEHEWAFEGEGGDGDGDGDAGISVGMHSMELHRCASARAGGVLHYRLPPFAALARLPHIAVHALRWHWHPEPPLIDPLTDPLIDPPLGPLGAPGSAPDSSRATGIGAGSGAGQAGGGGGHGAHDAHSAHDAQVRVSAVHTRHAGHGPWRSTWRRLV
jgi:hypothetical protein